MLTKSKIRFLLSVIFLAAIVFTSCDSPLGMGDPIDWEPPVVILDPGPNPRYIRLGTVIGGTATDNIGVERVIMREAKSGEELFEGKLLPNNRFEIILNFSEKDNGKKLSVEIVAYDKRGNAGVATLTVIVDLRPPLVESAWIERSSSKISWLEPINSIKTELEHEDPLGLKSEHINRYQNGWFTFTAKLGENETRIDDVILKIYDYNYFSEPILVPVREINSTLYAPRWVIKEEEIIQKGVEIFGESYRTNYYINKQRYYYYVSISAFDRSENEGTLQEIVEDQNFFCMWEQADEPKGIIDQIIGNTIYKKMPVPVQLFDDDSLEFAWAGLLTRKQWNGESPIELGVTVQGAEKEDKLNFLRDRLERGLDVRNWKYDGRYSGEHTGEPNLVEEFIKGRSNIDDLTVQIDTGSKDNDYGEFVLFTIVWDKKLDPHTGSGSVDTLKSRWAGRAYDVNIIDDNLPLIVFDTVDTSKLNLSACTAPNNHFCNHLGHDFVPNCNTGDSPEENTFPRLRTDGKIFEINGYTLRENNSGNNSVQRFRMAWIPNSVLGANEKAVIKQVENALRWHLDPLQPLEQSKPDNQFPAGVQFWVMDKLDYAASNSYSINGPGILTGTQQELQSTDQSGTTSTTRYIKQVFRKQFNILGDAADDQKGAYRNFTYNGLENETKVFVFCAIDNMQKVVFRTIRLLPNRTPPDLSVYDITGRNITGLPPGIPDVFTSDPAGNINQTYMNERKTYNENSATYNALKGVSSGLGDNDKTVSFQSYPRKTQIKYWVNAEKSGDLAIAGIKMQDVTFSADTYPFLSGEYPILGSTFITADRALSYIEYFPEVTSRVFLFTATDTLGNTAQIQRTIAITNAATLTNITTDKLDGKYGMGQVITLKANFDGRISHTGALSDILLNVRYANKQNPTVENDFIFRQIPCSRINTLSLEFDFIVSENDLGQLETMFDDSGMYHSHPNMNRPISFRNGAQIIDDIRKDQAFTPGNITGFSWTGDTYSLQDPSNGKEILLDGVRPRITGLAVSGKIPDTSIPPYTDYHFKAGETLQFTITSNNKDIRVRDNEPIIEYQIDNAGPYRAGFVYKSPSGTNGMTFTLEVNRTTLPTDGRITSFRLSGTAGKIVDDYGNEAAAFDFNTLLGSNIRIFNDQTPPLAPTVTLTPAPNSPAAPGAVGANPNTIWYYTTGPQLVIAELPLTNEPFTQTRSYSLDGGFSWTPFPGPVPLPNSSPTQPHSLQCRITDIAGNIGPTTNQQVHINSAFPTITSVNVVQPAGTYTNAAGQNALTFILNFDGNVRVNTAVNVTITLTNRNSTNSHNTGGTITNVTDESYQYRLQADAGQTTNTASIRFSWANIIGGTKEMRDGLYISAINLTGLQDQFGNLGGNGTSSSTGVGLASVITVTPGGYTVPNLPPGYIVDSIIPRANTTAPAIGADLAGLRNEITIQFNEPMMKGTGTISIRPADDSLIPPVFENDGYYLGTDGITRYTTPGALRTYVDGFYDIYNNAALGAADKQYLTESTNAAAPSWGTLRTNARTGHTVGPYQRLTHGLKAGNGYDGDYANGNQGAKNNYSAGNANGPNPQSGFMIPDTATKWVLDYKLRINDTTNQTIVNISNTLKKAHFRWQEIDVVNSGVIIDASGKVTIELNEPLLAGLHWVLSYPAGTFTDKAGNQAAGVAAHDFWTAGVQTPVIRVNRRSYDARQVGNPLNDLSTQASRGAYPAPPPANTAGWNAGIAVTDLNGWGIGDFNLIHYRIETETPGAAFTSGTYSGTTDNRVTNKSGVTAAFGGTVYDVNGSNRIGDSVWTNNTQSNGTWLLSNLIRRGNSVYDVIENGNTITRTYVGAYNGFRSYNKDATIGDLNGVGLVTFNPGTNNQGAIAFDALEAGKSYVVAQATRGGHTSAKGYEGVFRTIIAILNNGTFANVAAARPVIVEGSNIKNGMPSVAGFPVRDAEETGDNRFIKMFYRNANNDNSQLVWISTEVVCEWYFIKYGGRTAGATHMNAGEVNNYLMVGYGDLTYGFNLTAND
jgi:hypothetical protein